MKTFILLFQNLHDFCSDFLSLIFRQDEQVWIINDKKSIRYRIPYCD